MHDETERSHDAAEIAVLGVVRVPDLDAWSVRLTVPHGSGPVSGWAPVVFWSGDAARTWLASRGETTTLVRPAVRDCMHGPNELAVATVVDDRGEELLVSEPLPRTTAAGVAALFAAELRHHIA